jgi:ABC-type multidrug transport system ATPase subunit
VKELIIDNYLLSALKLRDQSLVDAFAYELSVGQQQKLAISLALSREANLYVMDEPFANLDQASRDIAINLILERTNDKDAYPKLYVEQRSIASFDR